MNALTVSAELKINDLNVYLSSCIFLSLFVPLFFNFLPHLLHTLCRYCWKKLFLHILSIPRLPRLFSISLFLHIYSLIGIFLKSFFIFVFFYYDTLFKAISSVFFWYLGSFYYNIFIVEYCQLYYLIFLQTFFNMLIVASFID